MPLVLSILSGVLAGASFPKYGFSLIAWVAYVPLLFSIKMITGRKVILKSYTYGLISGLVTNAILLYWVVVAMNRYGTINIFVSIAALVLLSTILSVLYSGTFALLVRLFWNSSLPGGLLFIPVTWVLLEYAKTYLFSGFPWELLGYSQYKDLPLIQISRFTAVYGLSFLIMLFNTLLYEVLAWWYDIRSVRTAKYPFLFIKTVAVLSLITGILVYGDIRINRTNAMVGKPGKDLDIALIQGDIDQSHKWDPVYQERTMADYLSLSLQAYERSHPELVVWPETATPFFFQSEPRYADMIGNFVRAHSTYMLFGSPTYQYTDRSVEYFNSALLMSDDGGVKGVYDKRHLVPFGEYLPLKRIFFFLKKLTDSIGAFTPGIGPEMLHFDGVRIGTLICYEIIFPQLSAEDARDGANLLVTITDDAWFGDTSAPYQHLSMTVFRAVENERFVLRAANTGISAVISPTGKILTATKLFVPAFIDYAVRPIDAKTFYTVHGDVFVLSCMMVFLAFVLSMVYRRLSRRLP
ncbi:MAG: apolipoprotein N-acyltransferase [Deltaproteobacteria bacterium]|nr:apolipoprotein N-acyltransferase [Deltaproteobacteria bacterium]MCL5277385.1 apolipoprotein N-acyltransferase [Deltaproteobacteria bacterium]